MKNNKRKVSILDTSFYNLIYKLMVFFIIASILIFILWPILAVILKSFFKDGTFSLELYKSLFKDNKRLLFNSLFVAILTTLISTIFSVVIAIYTSFSKEKKKKIIMFILLLTMISPPFVSALAYIQLFGRRGLITYKLLNIKWNPYGWQGIVSMQSLGFTSLNALMLIGIIKGMDKSLLQASRDLGASVSYTIRKVLIPLITPGIVVCALLTFIRSLSDFGTPMTIGGAFDVLATEIYLKVIAYGDLPLASAMSILIIMPTLILFIPYRIYMKNSNIISKSNLKISSQKIDFNLKGVIGFIFNIITMFFVIIMLLQYGSIFLSAITKFSYGKMKFTLDNIIYLKEYGMDSIIRSIVYGIISGVIGSFLGILIAYFVDRKNIKGMKFIDFVATMPYIIPGTFFGIGYILAFNNPPLLLTGTTIIVILNCIFKQLPMNTKTSSAALSQINLELDEASRDLGANRIYVIKDIIFPNMKTAFLIGFINSFTSTMTTLGAIIFLIYPGQKVATVELFDAINSGEYGAAAAIATIIIIITLSINLIFSKFILKDRNDSYVSSIK
ncbi:ABC transporter permease [Clostridium fallax]|uniref:Iron(III) transport system permease protein n=1 Tax=Clostridium fallax TaxID=1533 RepID=A0A1M4VY95_9CLOT|nr:iron ABC transporter permease [Clostridium fallax]SHE73927.1 iron(III) transport system permease protein [Clostridium fallax]SQB07753.1 ABC transporter permease [Clostridium fallax]